MTPAGADAPSAADLSRAVDVLRAESLASIVDLVAWPERDGSGRVEAVVVANHAGSSRLRVGAPHEVLDGRDPVADTDPLRFATYAEVVADPSPPNERNAYPLPAERLSSLFSDARAPDLAVVHSPRHYFPDRGGHLGEHGSLDVVQSRAPLLLSGYGVDRRGILAAHARTVDVGPTLAACSGVPAEALAGSTAGCCRSTWPPGHATSWASCGTARPSADLLHHAGTGLLPNVARLLERGLALQGGAVAEFPSITLCNHTSLLTGLGPGRHGVIGNVFYDRAAGAVVVPNDASTWHRSADWFRDEVVTVFEQVARHRPGAITASIDEPVDRGATHSTMGLIRAGEQTAGRAVGGAKALAAQLPSPLDSAYATREFVVADADYAWNSQIDDAGLAQVLGLWERADSAPALTWWSHIVTDAGHHAGGPRSPIATASLIDADRRLGDLPRPPRGDRPAGGDDHPAHGRPRLRGRRPRLHRRLAAGPGCCGGRRAGPRSGLPLPGCLMTACAWCGAAAPEGRPPLTWTYSVESGQPRWYCDRCARDHLRAIEGKLDSEYF